MTDKEWYCNVCGKKLNCKDGVLQEDALFVKKKWGYFSKKDLEIHEFVICEDCYDEMVAGFAKDISVSQKTEVLDD